MQALPLASPLTAAVLNERSGALGVFARCDSQIGCCHVLQAFERGFLMLFAGPAIHLFSATELERLVCGTPLLDFAALQRSARYDGGYHPQHQVRAFLAWASRCIAMASPVSIRTCPNKCQLHQSLAAPATVHV